MVGMEWSVGLVLEGAHRPLTEEDLDRLVDECADMYPGGAGFTPGQRGVTMHLYVKAAEAREALATVTTALNVHLGKASLSELEIVEATVTEWGRFERQLDEPSGPELVGVSELAALLQVTRQRASELAGVASFPEPLSRLRSGPIWDRRSVEGYVRDWDRRPGRRVAAAAGSLEREFRNKSGHMGTHVVKGSTGRFTTVREAGRTGKVVKEDVANGPTAGA